MNKRILALLALLFLSLSVMFSPVYKSLYTELLDLFATFFVPALFPSVFLTILIAKTADFPAIFKKSRAGGRFLLFMLAGFGGTLTAISVLQNTVFDDRTGKEKAVALLSGGSFAYILFVFSVLGKMQGLILALAALALKVLLAELLIPPFEVKDEIIAKNYIFRSLDEATLTFANMLKSMALITLIIPVLSLISNSLVSDYLLGLAEFTRSALKLVQRTSKLSLTLAFWVIEFNGLTSLVQIKKAHPEVRFSHLFGIKVLTASLFAFIPFLLF